MGLYLIDLNLSSCLGNSWKVKMPVEIMVDMQVP